MNDLLEQVNALRWHHQIDLGEGVITPGNTGVEYLRRQQQIYLRDIAGKSFLDVGCWDGSNSFAAKARGASRVLATDHFAWSPSCWGDRRSFELARGILAPDVEVMDIDLPDLSPLTVGKFDVVLFAGVFYHLRNPFEALERISELATEQLVVETHIDALDVPRPAMIFYPGKELANDETNWWGPNIACIHAMLRDCGFSHIETHRDDTYGPRATFLASR